jgi:glutamate-1-semialdehyde 2,1-aminomutase
MSLTVDSTISISEQLAEQARRYTPGGVHSSTRALQPPLVWKAARGSRLTDVDGRDYVDYHAAFGPIILGHRNARVDEAAIEAIGTVDLIGVGSTELEIQLARKLVEHLPSAECALLCVTGSEATFNAVRLARAVTGRKKLAKFQGCYHGWHDYLCMNVISPADKLGQYDPASAGMLEESIQNTVVLPFNDLAAVEDALRTRQIAGLIVEPIPHNIGCVMPQAGFLEGLRELATMYGTVLIFDEVITGFRHGLGGYQARCGVTPDLTTVAKSMANGYPVAALCGKRDLMTRFQTSGGDVFFAGTYNGHPTGVAAALSTIEQMEDGAAHGRLFADGAWVAAELTATIERLRLEAQVAQYGSVFVIYFLAGPVRSYADLLRNDKAKDIRFRRGMIERGFFCLPLPMKRNHISAAHSREDLSRTLQAAEDVLKEIARS